MFSLQDIARRRVDDILARHPELVYQWSSNGARLVLPARDDGGFDVDLQFASDELVVGAIGFHEHFPVETGGPEETCDTALGLIRDMLSPHMRLREKAAEGRPYKWILDVLTPQGWAMESETGLLWFNYFGTRSERVYVNHHLPGRLGLENHPST